MPVAEGAVAASAASRRLPGPIAARGAIAGIFGLLIAGGRWSDPASLAGILGVFLLLAAASAGFAAGRFGSRSLAALCVVDAALGLLLAIHQPWQGLATLDYLVGAWAVAAGILEMFAAGTFARDRATEGLEAASGILLAGVGAFLGVFPETRLAVFSRLTGAALLASGALLALAAARLGSRGD
jgi:uncharacterized membrane protein HdeD (DUF308 family)